MHISTSLTIATRAHTSAGSRTTGARRTRLIARGLLACLLMPCPGLTMPAQQDNKSGQEQSNAQSGKPATEGDKPDQPEGIKDLLSGTFDETWQHVCSQQGTKREDVWKLVSVEETVENKRVKRRVLVCAGTPKGYLRTKAKYSNFDFAFECRYAMDENGNSGVLVYASSDKEKVWPDCMQIQLHRPEAGSIFPIGAARSDYRVDAKAELGDIKKWAKCVIRSADGKLTVLINGKVVGEVTGCQPRTGHIALQSEGSEILFRNVRIGPPGSLSETTSTADNRGSGPADSSGP